MKNLKQLIKNIDNEVFEINKNIMKRIETIKDKSLRDDMLRDPYGDLLPEDYEDANNHSYDIGRRSALAEISEILKKVNGEEN